MIERRRSKIHGWRVYATRTIPKNTRIIDDNTDGEGLIKCRCRPGCQVLL